MPPRLFSLYVNLTVAPSDSQKQIGLPAQWKHKEPRRIDAAEQQLCRQERHQTAYSCDLSRSTKCQPMCLPTCA